MAEKEKWGLSNYFIGDLTLSSFCFVDHFELDDIFYSDLTFIILKLAEFDDSFMTSLENLQ